MSIDNGASIKSLTINRKIVHYKLYNCIHFILFFSLSLSAEKSPEFFPKHKGYFLFQNLLLGIDIFL